MGTLLWTTLVGSVQSHESSYRREVEGEQTEKMKMEPWRQRLECCGHKSREVSSHQKLLEEARNGFSPRASEGSMTLLTTYFRLLASRIIRHKFVVSIHQVAGNLLWQHTKLMQGNALTSSSFSSAVSRNRSGRKGFTPLEFSTLKIFSDGIRIMQITRKNTA